VWFSRDVFQDCAERRRWFEAGHPDVAFVTPARGVPALTLIGWLPLIPLGGKLTATANSRRGIIKPTIPAAPAGRRRASPGLRT
jgi:hypothetical protein